MRSLILFAAAATATPAPASSASAPSYSHTATALSDIAAAAATAKTSSPTSHVAGKVFDRIAQIYLETTDFDHAIADPNCQALYERGILLTQLFGVAEPSQPAYVAAASGDYFGTNSDSFEVFHSNISTIVDLLDDRGISWADYNEGLPYSGFDGFEYDNPVEGHYVRKHNLLMRFHSIALNASRTAQVKNLTVFHEDLARQTLPQWIFITPNLYHNGHDTNISVSCDWTRRFVEPLLLDTAFDDGRTLVYITWQANGQDGTARNHVAGMLLGSAVPAALVGTNDTAYYNHYSELSSVEANWGLHTLGRWDVGANVWQPVARATGDETRAWNATVARGSFASYYWNQSYGGLFSSAASAWHVYVAPNLQMRRNGRSALPAIADLWRAATGTLPDYYHDVIELPDALHPPRRFQVPVGLEPPMPITTPITIWPDTGIPSV